MRLLIIEDNIKLCDSMKAGLMQAGFQVDVAYQGEQGEYKAFVNDYDAVLLDLNLPDKDGLEILKFLRGEQRETPIIIITARDEVQQRAMGLDLGADDYLTKPFALVELRARIQAVIRRFHGRTNPVITLGQLQISPVSHVAKWGEDVIPLVAKEFDILEYIASKHPALVSSEEIAEHVYDESFDPFSSALRVHLSRLRKKLQESSGRELLVTTRGKGYSLCTE